MLLTYIHKWLLIYNLAPEIHGKLILFEAELNFWQIPKEILNSLAASC